MHLKRKHHPSAVELVRQHTTAAVLFHHALAERLELGPTDLKCMNLLREGGPMTGSELASRTGLTTGAITGVVSRLERAGFLQRRSDPNDGRRQILSQTTTGARDLHAVFARLHAGLDQLLAGFSTSEYSAIARFLAGSTELIYGELARTRAEASMRMSAGDRPRSDT